MALIKGTIIKDKQAHTYKKPRRIKSQNQYSEINAVCM